MDVPLQTGISGDLGFTEVFYGDYVAVRVCVSPPELRENCPSSLSLTGKLIVQCLVYMLYVLTVAPPFLYSHSSRT